MANTGEDGMEDELEVVGVLNEYDGSMGMRVVMRIRPYVRG